MNLRNFVKANLLAGLLGTLVLAPLAFIYELVVSGPTSPLLEFTPAAVAINIFSLVAFPLVVGVAFAITALAAYPVVSLLQRQGLLSFKGEP